MSPWAINRLAKSIQQGAIFAYPTDTIWGLGCHPLLTVSVGRILNIKQRPVEKGLILLCSDFDLFKPYISNCLNSDQTSRISEKADHPVTWIVPASAHCPAWIRGHSSGVAIRVTSHPFVKAICAQIRSPIVSTSANRAGSTPVRNSWQAHRHFNGQVDSVVSGYDSGTMRASEIKSLESGQLIRAHLS